MTRRASLAWFFLLFLAGTYAEAASSGLVRLADDEYLITHGSLFKMPGEMGLRHSAALCKVLGYSWFVVVSETTPVIPGAMGQIRARFSHEESTDAIECAPLSTEKLEKKMAKNLKKMSKRTGKERASKPAEPASGPSEDPPKSGAPLV